METKTKMTLFLEKEDIHLLMAFLTAFLTQKLRLTATVFVFVQKPQLTESAQLPTRILWKRLCTLEETKAKPRKREALPDY